MFPVDSQGGRYHPMHRAAFGPIYASGCPVNGDCGCGRSTGLAEEFNCQLDQLAAHDIPVTAYLFDGSAWSRAGSNAPNSCEGPDCCVWDLGDQVIERMARVGVRGVLHFWGGCHDDEQYRRAGTRLGGNLLGFYLDDGSSDRELMGVSEFMEQAEPGNWENYAKGFQNRQPSNTTAGLARWANVAYVGDLPVGFEGLKSAVTRVLALAPTVPAPFAELTGYDNGDGLDPGRGGLLPPAALRRAAARHGPHALRQQRPVAARVLGRARKAYRYWAWFHKQLVPFFYSLAYRMYEDPTQPVLRPGPMADSLLVGESIYAPIVTPRPTRWTSSCRPASGSTTGTSRACSRAASPATRSRSGASRCSSGRGAIIPLRVERDYTGQGSAKSGDALTVLVYPSDNSTFRYRPDALAGWITFTAAQSYERLTLIADPGLPSEPVIFRVARWSTTPESVGVFGASVSVNQGGDMDRAESEADASGTDDSAFYYDASQQRLIIRVVP